MWAHSLRLIATCSPEIVQYTYVCISLGPNHSTDQLRPPTDCGPVGSWAGISLNFTVTSNGTQYDRLGEHASTELGIISEFIFRFFEGVFTFQNVESRCFQRHRSTHRWLIVLHSMANFDPGTYDRWYHLDILEGRNALHPALFEPWNFHFGARQPDRNRIEWRVCL